MPAKGFASCPKQLVFLLKKISKELNIKKKKYF